MTHNNAKSEPMRDPSPTGGTENTTGPAERPLSQRGPSWA